MEDQDILIRALVIQHLRSLHDAVSAVQISERKLQVFLVIGPVCIPVGFHKFFGHINVFLRHIVCRLRHLGPLFEGLQRIQVILDSASIIRQLRRDHLMHRKHGSPVRPVIQIRRSITAYAIDGFPISRLILTVPDPSALSGTVSVQIQAVQPLHLTAMSLDVFAVIIQPFLRSASFGSGKTAVDLRHLQIIECLCQHLQSRPDRICIGTSFIHKVLRVFPCLVVLRLRALCIDVSFLFLCLNFLLLFFQDLGQVCHCVSGFHFGISSPADSDPAVHRRFSADFFQLELHHACTVQFKGDHSGLVRTAQLDQISLNGLFAAAKICPGHTRLHISAAVRPVKFVVSDRHLVLSRFQREPVCHGCGSA